MQVLPQRHKQRKIKPLRAFQGARVSRHRIPCLLSVHQELYYPDNADASQL